MENSSATFRDTKVLEFARRLLIFNAIPFSDADLANYSGLVMFFYDCQ